ncbi:hypothetical protein P8452_08120 [Trifolium repens]|nr:hypothetical protein P8452_08120 [Trifolium repens]
MTCLPTIVLLLLFFVVSLTLSVDSSIPRVSLAHARLISYNSSSGPFSLSFRAIVFLLEHLLACCIRS